jgi:uncharacterized protein YbjT (DUF2867 family)
MNRQVFITGGTGYMGSRLIPLLLKRGHVVKALVREGSKHKLPAGCTAVIGDALDRSSFVHHVRPADTFVHLIGVAHPSPAKADQFRSIDLVSVRESLSAAVEVGVNHFVYLSVAQPAPVLKAYVEVRAEGEAMIRASGLNATFLRPWYVLGPGHWWPYIVVPLFWVLERLPATKERVQRLGFVTIDEMVNTLLDAIENPSDGVRVLQVPDIRQKSKSRIP